jgi:topoisomerase-4 subunit A
MIPIDQDEKIIQAIPVKDFAEDKFLVFFTKFGMVKKSPLSLYKPQRYSRPLTAVNLREKDAVINVRLSEGSDDILIVTRLGYGILYAETEVNPIGARALGVKGIDLKDGDEVAGAEIISEGANPSVVMITNRGAAKKIKLTEFERSSRARRGSVLLRELKNNPHRVIGLSILYDERPIHVLTDRNHIVKLDPSALKFHDRHSNGTFFMDEKANGSAIELWKDPDPA